MEAFSLFEVNQYIRRVISANFDEPIWVECEINQYNESRGHAYLNLIEKEEDSENIIAKSSATIWYKQLGFIRKKLGKVAYDILSEGVKVKLKVQVEFNERFGMSLNVLDIDPSFTYGVYEIQRQKIIARLEQEDLTQQNSLLVLPPVIQNVAIISSGTAAGYQDFINQLRFNSYNYAFNVELFQAAMQGSKTEKEVVSALNNACAGQYDLIAIIRGGGSKLDLSAFDNYNIAKAIALSPIPVFTGIGHDIDMTVSDIVSHSVLKTPTAVADYIIEHNLTFESEVQQLMDQMIWHIKHRLSSVKNRLSVIESQLYTLPETLVKLKFQSLEKLQATAFTSASHSMEMKMAGLKSFGQIIDMMQPENVLKKGFTLVSQNGHVVAGKKSINRQLDSLSIRFYDGEEEVKLIQNEE